VRGYEPRGREFEFLRARHKNNHLQLFEKSILPLNQAFRVSKSTTWASSVATLMAQRIQHLTTLSPRSSLNSCSKVIAKILKLRKQIA